MFTIFDDKGYAPPATRASGYCSRCETEHWLGVGNTLPHCLHLMKQFREKGTIDLYSSQNKNNKSLQLSYLFGPAGGKMFGIMECLRSDGTTIILRAFSGQYNGRWLVKGWAPPLFDIDAFHTLTGHREQQIKELSRLIDLSARHSDSWSRLKKERRRLSQDLMLDIHDLYRVSNFRGQSVPLREAFCGSKGIPTGAGDCCAPKLFNFAARKKLRPLGIIEFYWGQENRSGTYAHGSFTSSCREKCQPLLGYMLCGLEHTILESNISPPAAS